MAMEPVSGKQIYSACVPDLAVYGLNHTSQLASQYGSLRFKKTID